MSEGNKAVVRRLFEELDKHNFKILDEVCSPDFTFHLPGYSMPMKFEEWKRHVLSVYEAFPDFHHKIEDLIAEGDRVVVRYTGSGTQKGEFMGVAPTGKEVTLGAIAIYRFAKGKIVEGWEQVDLLGMMQQLGALPQLGKG